MSDFLFAPYIDGPGVRFTDLQAMERMFQVRDIEYDKGGIGVGGHTLTVEGGYAGFATTFTFDDEGRLCDVAAHE